MPSDDFIRAPSRDVIWWNGTGANSFARPRSLISTFKKNSTNGDGFAVLLLFRSWVILILFVFDV